MNGAVGQPVSFHDRDRPVPLGEHRRGDEAGDARTEDHGVIVHFPASQEHRSTFRR
jgi:hypothetical protein